MRVDSVKTENFRLLQSQEVKFGEGINVICGSNAQGKTTLLEAVYLLTGMKSFRSRFDKDLIAFGADCAFLEGQVEACGREQRVDMRFQRGKTRQIRVNGALFEVENDVLTVVAIDGYRLALRREQIDKCDSESMRFIVPGSALSDMEKICSGGEGDVRINVGSKHISFTVGDTILITRRLEGEFLNYRKTVPSQFPIQVKAKRTELIRCAERVSLIIDDRAKNPLRCRFGNGELKISCATPLGRAEDTCALEGNGGDTLVGFNNSYLLQALKAAPADEVTVNLTNGSSPCVLLPCDGSDDFLYMILPVRLHSGE